MARAKILAGPIVALAVVAACRQKPEEVPPAPSAAPVALAAVVDAGPPPEPSPREARTEADAQDPFGVARTASRAGCAVLADRHMPDVDLRTSFVDGDDLLAVVNRSPSGQLAPDYAPRDLVDVRTKKPASASDCDGLLCLRSDAAGALDELLGAMKKEGFPGHVESAFRSYGAQCGTFGNWARKSSFCEATEQSALPGHSQHQLGTTVDLFTEEWAKDPRGVFREGFGCTPAGRWIREHATEHGFVVPYPIHPDDRHPRQRCVARWDIPVNINPRTGYRYEHWHIRYVGKDAAQRFRTAFEASGPGTPGEITVEQWLRSEKRLGGADVELPVCDGCNCGACATLAESHACDRKGGALHLDAHGRPIASAGAPAIANVAKGKARKWRGAVVEVKLEVPAGTITQPPIAGLDAAGYVAGATFERLAPYPETEPRAFAPLAGAWVVAVEPVPNDTGVAWPYRAALAAAAVGQIYNRADVILPARTGAITVKVPIPAAARAKVVLLKGGVPTGQERAVELE